MLQCVVSLFTSLMDESFLLAACQFMLPQNTRNSPFNAEATNIGREKKTTTDNISAGRPTVAPRFGSGGRIDPNIDGTYNPDIGSESILMWQDQWFTLLCKLCKDMYLCRDFLPPVVVFLMSRDSVRTGERRKEIPHKDPPSKKKYKITWHLMSLFLFSFFTSLCD